jgi:hypothetical protein
MDSIFWTLLGVALDNPDLQEKIAGPCADFLKTKLPPAEDKAIGDLLCRLGGKLGGTVPAA